MVKLHMLRYHSGGLLYNFNQPIVFQIQLKEGRKDNGKSIWVCSFKLRGRQVQGKCLEYLCFTEGHNESGT